MYQRLDGFCKVPLHNIGRQIMENKYVEIYSEARLWKYQSDDRKNEIIYTDSNDLMIYIR